MVSHLKDAHILTPSLCYPAPTWKMRNTISKLQGEGALQPEVFGLVDDPHPATAQLLQNAVVRNGLADLSQVALRRPK